MNRSLCGYTEKFSQTREYSPASVIDCLRDLQATSLAVMQSIYLQQVSPPSVHESEENFGPISIVKVEDAARENGLGQNVLANQVR